MHKVSTRTNNLILKNQILSDLVSNQNQNVFSPLSGRHCHWSFFDPDLGEVTCFGFYVGQFFFDLPNYVSMMSSLFDGLPLLNT